MTQTLILNGTAALVVCTLLTATLVLVPRLLQEEPSGGETGEEGGGWRRQTDPRQPDPVPPGTGRRPAGRSGRATVGSSNRTLGGRLQTRSRLAPQSAHRRHRRQACASLARGSRSARDRRQQCVVGRRGAA